MVTDNTAQCLPTLPAWFTSSSQYNGYCKGLASIWSASKEIGENFSKYLGSINQGGKNIIKTGWGGVYITHHKHPEVEKFLVIKQGNYLAFEKHAEKVETLRVDEGTGALIYRPANSSELKLEIISPGFEITLRPGQEHCIVGLTNLLVFEKSKDFKGMDQDLIFIFEPA